MNEHPLTPTKTPNSAKFDTGAFATPTFASNHRDFESNWNTPNTHVFGAQGPSAAVYQLTPGSTSGFDQADSRRADYMYSASGPPAQGHMRTPISTRIVQSGDGRPSTASMADGKKTSAPGAMRPPQTPKRGAEASPHLFPTLQFSPDLFQYPMSGPMTAPIVPQHRLFWDSNDDSAMFSSSFQETFNTDTTEDPGHFLNSPATSSTLRQPNMASLQQPLMLSPASNTFGVSSSPSQFDGAVFPAPFTASPRVVASRPEDPSMFLSSPARRFGPVNQPVILPKVQPRTGGEAYHHQKQESKRERDERSKKTKPRKESTQSSLKSSMKPATPPLGSLSRPGIRRSATHSGVAGKLGQDQRQNQVSSAGSFAYTNEVTGHPPHAGRSSPLKRPFDRSSLDIERPASRNRVSLSFTIDEDGRARTVPKSVAGTTAENDSFSDANSIDNDDFDVTTSRNTSFAFAQSGSSNKLGNQLHATQPSHSKSSSYSSTYGSSNSANLSSRTSSMRGANSSAATMHNVRRAEDMISPTKDQSGDAQHALRAAMRDRDRSTARSANDRAVPFLQTQAFHSSPPIQQTSYDYYTTNNISPTTITDPDLTTPSTDRASYVSGSTRCICSSSDQVGRFMIQCESCSKWLHMKCVGLDPSHVPPVYVCIYCAQTPMRHGRIREPMRANALSATSPLAHKSYRQG